MRKGKQPQRKVQLPLGWWLRLNDICRSQWGERDAHLDIFEFTHISRRSFATARAIGQMTEQLFSKLAAELGYKNHDDLLRDLGPNHRRLMGVKPVPRTIVLTTQRGNPQWADYRDFPVEAARPWRLQCRVTTESPYFRFGFKLLGLDGRVFGDGAIKSFDANLIVHIGRNNWDRPALRITAKDIFLTAYMSGGFIEEDDRFLFESRRKVVIPIELTIDRSYCASLTVNGQLVFQHIIPPDICSRVVAYGWGDREEFHIEVTDLVIGPATDGGLLPETRCVP